MSKRYVFLCFTVSSKNVLIEGTFLIRCMMQNEIVFCSEVMMQKGPNKKITFILWILFLLINYVRNLISQIKIKLKKVSNNYLQKVFFNVGVF
jgi:aminopeptidase C